MPISVWNNLRDIQTDKKTFLVVGIDPVHEQMPDSIGKSDKEIAEFCKNIVNSTAEHGCAFKPNLAFYLALGKNGLDILRETIEAIKAKELPVILDGKFNDIGHTAGKYAKFAKEIGADFVTISPYIGFDTVKPFIDEGLCAIILCATSNPGFLDVQGFSSGEIKLYRHVASKAEEWIAKTGDKIGLVVGATHPGIFKEIRESAPSAPFLIPGIGAQGGELETAMKYAFTCDGFGPMIVAARSVIYASKGTDYSNAAADSAAHHKTQINNAKK